MFNVIYVDIVNVNNVEMDGKVVDKVNDVVNSDFDIIRDDNEHLNI